MSATGERAQAFEAAEDGDFPKALQLAENVSEAWYRCQSLAAVARYAPDEEVVRVANKAFKAAKEAGDAYKRVAVCAWPIRALAERGKTEQVETALGDLLEEAQQIEPPVSKVVALHMVWEATWLLPTAIKQTVLDALVTACRADNSWKAGRILSYVVLVLASEDADQARRIADSMREGPYRRWTQKRLDAEQTETVRGFFTRRRTAQEEAEWMEYVKKRAARRAEEVKKREIKREQHKNRQRPNP